ncbi:MAG TPA: sugar ABC transporter permease, partial [Lachnoclostridium sp.]|nr:sugar ABC transporter permease [Lachnoclostridium sp.]
MMGNSLSNRIRKDLQRNWTLYLLVLPVLIYYAVFMYKPMYGAIIAFKDFTPAKGVFGSEWVGFENFTRFFTSPYFGRLLKNTLLLSIYSIIFGFPAPIILALLLNEVKNAKFKKFSQTITYLPHFISLVVACGMIKDFCLTTGL